jgi:phosphate/phosphite/phosphonate ABC transporter binding protein
MRTRGGWRAAWARVGLVWALLVCAACTSGRVNTPRRSDPLEKLSDQGVSPRRLSIGLPPATPWSTEKNNVNPLLRYLQSRLGIPVDMAFTKSYEELGGLLERGDVQVAVVSPLAYVKMRSRLPIVRVASASNGGTATYVGYIVVHKNSGYDSLESLRGKTIGWVDLQSTSGYLYPRAMMRWRGYEPDQFFREQRFTGSHSESLRALLEGRVDAVAIASSFVDPGEARRFAEADELRVVAKTSQIPFDCVVVRSNLSRGFARKIRGLLLRFDDDRQASLRLMDSWGIGGYVEGEEFRYDPVEDALHRESRRIHKPVD